MKNATIERLKDDTSSVSSKGSLDNKTKAIINIETASSQDGFIDDSIENMLANNDHDFDQEDGIQHNLDLSMEVAEIMEESTDTKHSKIPDNKFSASPKNSDSDFINQSDSESSGDDTEPVHIEVESISNECRVSSQFIDLLFSTVHIKGESRLAQEVQFTSYSLYVSFWCFCFFNFVYSDCLTSFDWSNLFFKTFLN